MHRADNSGRAIYRRELRRRLLSAFNAVAHALDKTRDRQSSMDQAKTACAVAQQEVAWLRQALDALLADLRVADEPASGDTDEPAWRGSSPSWPARHSISTH